MKMSVSVSALLFISFLLLLGDIDPAAGSTIEDDCNASPGFGGGHDNGSGNWKLPVECRGGGGSGGGGEPDGYWATWRTLDSAPPPACLYEAGGWFDVASQADADAIGASRSLLTDRWVEDQLTLDGVITYRCDTPPTVDADTVFALVEGLLPRPEPTIAGGRAITGNRSWLDLGRPSTYSTSDTFDLGAFGSAPVTVTGTAVATIDWGDGTVTDHTGAGGPYHEGEPGPDDVTHTYIDTGNPTIAITDTWTLTFEIAGVDTVTASGTLEPVTMDVEVNQVRSVRQE